MRQSPDLGLNHTTSLKEAVMGRPTNGLEVSSLVLLLQAIIQQNFWSLQDTESKNSSHDAFAPYKRTTYTSRRSGSVLAVGFDASACMEEYIIPGVRWKHGYTSRIC
jgi:hypothetical protein